MIDTGVIDGPDTRSIVRIKYHRGKRHRECWTGQ